MGLGFLTSGLETFTKNNFLQEASMFFKQIVLKVWLLLPRGELW